MERKKFQKNYLIGACIFVLIVLGGYLVIDAYLYIDTDNASVVGHSSLLAFKVGGIVEQVLVDENQNVKAGEALAVLDKQDYQNTLEWRIAEKEALVANLEAAKKTYQRTKELFLKKVTSAEKLDLDESTMHALSARVKAAESNIHLAKRAFEDCTLKSPVDGKIAKKSLEKGMFINPGQPVLGFVASDTRWVIANLKETDLGYIQVGQPTKITVDALGSKVFEGKVHSIAPATGSSFTLLPPDNATGNFTKVIQRVPVKIEFLNLTSDDIATLGNGLSVVVKIRVH